MLNTLHEHNEIPGTHALISWRSVLAGLLITFFVFAVLIAAGMAFGGYQMVEATSAKGAGAVAGIWFLASSVIALFFGGYFAARVSKFHTGRIGLSHGLLIAALFFGAFLYQSFSTIGMLGRTAGSAVSGSAQLASQIADSPAATDAIENSLGGLTLQTDPHSVVVGLASRLFRGDTTSARDYLAYQANITPDEADRRVEALRTQVEASLVQAREMAAKALQATGWSLLIMTVLGAVASMIGGAWGARANVVRPLLVPEGAPLVRRGDEFLPAQI